MTTVQYRGFAGVRLEADIIGSENDPAVLLLHGAGQTRPITAGNGLASTMRRKAYSCHRISFSAGLSRPRVMVNQPFRLFTPMGTGSTK